MESVPAGYEDRVMEIITIVGAVLTGLVTIVVGVYSLFAIWFEDLV